MRDLNKEMNMRHDIWFSLSIKQQRKLNAMGYSSSYNLVSIPVEDFKKVTKSKRLLNLLIQLKRATLRIARRKKGMS